MQNNGETMRMEEGESAVPPAMEVMGGVRVFHSREEMRATIRRPNTQPTVAMGRGIGRGQVIATPPPVVPGSQTNVRDNIRITGETLKWLMDQELTRMNEMVALKEEVQKIKKEWGEWNECQAVELALWKVRARRAERYEKELTRQLETIRGLARAPVGREYESETEDDESWD